MKLVPFFLTKHVQNSFTIVSLSLFLSHAGKSLWTTDESGALSASKILEDYCEPNGFVVESIRMEDTSLAFVQVQPEKMNLADFYSWEEALQTPSKPECWRKFYFIQDKDGAEWWSPKGLLEAELQGFGSISELWRHLRTLYYV
jgi:hypothetical protein